MTGFPSLSVPCGFTASGLPVGLQLIGRPFGEAALYRFAHAYERAVAATG
jgi:aspartyl-tRNA(Asn)/glutamyl-tRNA(Gln) amidotransferase subunit A